MDVAEAIRTRRHIKLFKPDPVDMDKVQAWLEAASYAPNHRLNEPWEILVVGEQTRQAINHGPNFGNAPLVLAILSKRAEKQVDRDENLIAVSCFIQNFSLLAHAEGVGVRWTSVGWGDPARQALGVDDSYDVVNILGVGYPAEVPQVRERTPITEKIRQLP
ncbi:nitroreductase family protein [Alicyclobacillus acidiphilus]|jgi:nitroreductase|uniref:nitroreductase family protein n=1 Tax=Alicyclobacillus acidiphilus TaxID=182455 RepID=UPI000833AC1A|nr:nitroreductase family protein [Alicyclobacillus acidiphilus]